MSAVEDMLQDDVVPTIQNIKQSGVNFWILTGDKLETAEFICKSVNLKEERNEFVKLVKITDPVELMFKLRELQNPNQHLFEVFKVY